ncbi:MAG: hypothetical protein DYG94_12985 [Leptolyngbya sp. PLA3]|nr:MAG: hypothetical protein EDM82_03160 [Cyanobacteria bacterium CYA]MCE7969640.1 hypothetical protein [Leptolyngbya sp. PL-A3]
MSGITTGTGLFSGIDTASLIEQLLAISARPRILAQKRMVQLQVKQSAVMDINTALSGLKSAAAAFRTSNPFENRTATSTAIEVMTASAGKTASPGSYSFIVDRLVSTQQMLSRGFADLDVSGQNAGTWSFEPEDARLDRDLSLSTLNGGLGIERGTITITDSNGDTAEVDLSRVATVNEVLDAINAASGISVTARVEDDHFVLVGATSVVSQTGRNTAEDLGLDAGSASVSGGKLTGGSVYQMGDDTALSSLNDGMGVNFGTDIGDSRYDFVITIDPDGSGSPDDPVEVRVNIGSKWVYEDEELVEGETRVTTVEGVITRINEALSAAGLGTVTASIDASNGRIVLDGDPSMEMTVTERSGGTTARDLGLLGSGTGVINGDRVLAGMNTTLLSNINGGSGLQGDQIDFTVRTGATFSITGLSSATTVDGLIRLINDDATNAGRIVASLNSNGTGITITDTTGGTGNLIIGGDAGEGLGIDTDVAGVASNTVSSGDLEHRYMSESTLLSSLKEGQGIGTGKFRITDALGGVAEITIDSSTLTLGHVIKKINDANIAVTARINDSGDGIIIEEDTTDGTGAAKIKIEDVTGSTAKSLRIAGTAEGTDADNYIDGSLETHLEFDATDTLKEIMTKINASNAGVSVSAINTGAGANPFKLSIVSKESGTNGRFVMDTGDFNLGLTTLDKGHDARVFFGSADPASAVLITNSSNTMDGVISGVTVDLHSASEDPVTLTIAQDQTSIETQIKTFVDAYNNLMKRIATQTRYVEETKEKGPLLGDGTMISMRNAVVNQLLSDNYGFSDTFDQLADVGLSLGTGGVLEFDKERFREAYEEDPESVEALFNKRTIDPDGNDIPMGEGITGRDPNAGTVYSELGVIPQIEQFIDVYINTIDGVLTRKNESITDQIELQKKDIERINATLEVKRAKLTQQFAAMEQAIAQLQAQQNALSSIQMIG